MKKQQRKEQQILNDIRELSGEIDHLLGIQTSGNYKEIVKKEKFFNWTKFKWE